MKLEKYCIYNFHQNEDGFVYVYTDGSWEGNGTAAACAGLGVYFGEGHTLNAVSGRATNNCRKFQAAALAIRLAKQQGITVKNQVDVEELDRELADKSIKIKWSHVDVDCGILGNERADALARESSAIFRRQKVNR
ncbi:ribonuclease H1 [Culex quinquefasciatus]|uniref:Ribonuclease H1 n=1 Tax=Culex quinquefasciatus TaxID=7176 RepID=B0W0Z8_CULQU|nr:ribonuclease H1 [Culex quinquefasciatus]|eukprot:XP_001842382.1 ribonuclease H1 [Culex quinquefasciatus]